MIGSKSKPKAKAKAKAKAKPANHASNNQAPKPIGRPPVHKPDDQTDEGSPRMQLRMPLPIYNYVCRRGRQQFILALIRRHMSENENLSPEVRAEIPEMQIRSPRKKGARHAERS